MVSSKYILTVVDERRKQFNAAFYNASSQMYSDGKLSLQTAQALALQIGAVEPSNLATITNSLLAAVHNKKDHLDTGLQATLYYHLSLHGTSTHLGIIGTKYLLPALTENGNFDLALTIATQSTTPGWGWWVSQHATTLWESWFATEFEPTPNVYTIQKMNLVATSRRKSFVLS